MTTKTPLAMVKAGGSAAAGASTSSRSDAQNSEEEDELHDDVSVSVPESFASRPGPAAAKPSGVHANRWRGPERADSGTGGKNRALAA